MANLAGDFAQLIERDQKSARPLLRDLADRMPKSVEARVLLAQSYLRSLEAEEALHHYRIAHELEPQNLGIRHQMGLCSVALGDYEGAYKIFSEATSIAPTEHSQTMAALMLHRLGRIQEAIQAYSKLLGPLKRDHLEAPHALRGAVMLLRDIGAPLAADRHLQELIAIYRLDPQRVASLLVERDNSIDHFGWTRFASKSDLARALTRYAASPDAPRFPVTFVLPGDRDGLLAYAEAHPEALFISKPQRGTGGQDMTISRDAAALAGRSDVVVQRYIDRPYLVDGRKGHVRLHGLVTSLDPFRAYLHAEGIVRFAPDEYDATEAGLANVHGHVTNTALHAGHPKLVVSTDPSKENEGAVWSLTAYLDRLKADGVDVDALRADLRALMKSFLGVVAAEGVFADQMKAGPRRSFSYKLFGLDVLIDADAKPWLIEAQRKPALGGSALTQRIATRMLQTIFEMNSGILFDDSMPADRIASLAKDRGAVLRREAEHEFAHRGQFEPLS